MWVFECTHFLAKSSVMNKRALFSGVWELSVTFPTSSYPLTTSPDAERMWSFFLLTIVLFHRVDYYWMCYFGVWANTHGYSRQISWSTLWKGCTITGLLSSPRYECNHCHLLSHIFSFIFLRNPLLPSAMSIIINPIG